MNRPRVRLAVAERRLNVTDFKDAQGGQAQQVPFAVCMGNRPKLKTTNMKSLADKTYNNKSQAVSAVDSQMQRHGESTFQLVDDRPTAFAQRKPQEMANKVHKFLS